MNIALRIFLGYFLIVALAALLLAQVFVAQVKPGVRQAMEDTLVDTANLLAELAADDLRAGRIADGQFARAVRAVRERDFGASIWGFSRREHRTRIYVTDARGIVVFDSEGRDVGKDYSRWNDVYLTLRGRYGARSTRSDPADETSTVMHVAAPVRDGDRIVGVLTVARPNRTLAPFIARSQAIVTRWGFVLMGSALLIGIGVAWWLSRQLRRLQRYAQAATAGERAPLPAMAGEFGELGRALDTMRTRLEGKQYVEQYVHTLTHEMKGPLAAIRAGAELLEEPVANDMGEADRRRFAASIRAQSERLALMIDKLLALAEVEHRRRLDHPERVPLTALLQDVAAQAQPRLVLAGLDLALAPPEADAAVQGDPFLLRQALANLVENALDFAPRGSTIELAAHREHGQWAIEVADRGPGIPDYARPRVFERFYSLPRPEGGSRSSGLGLTFVAEVAALHGGSAELHNRDGGGARAVLRLPAA
ncbi:two-component system sensor histidine kinase CreC [Vulcaniibacterium gelatinicum]|uniref:two-component system sensor histidine kinase CreC n=1 Tax=Vulcaniibacterium gelatinicum TaxID=2598725 RepID=UPI0011CB067C|nr:two-component system sensor histidine kinase CreC [Vulcaniibacterium gelatinicum]